MICCPTPDRQRKVLTACQRWGRSRVPPSPEEATDSGNSCCDGLVAFICCVQRIPVSLQGKATAPSCHPSISRATCAQYNAPCDFYQGMFHAQKSSHAQNQKAPGQTAPPPLICYKQQRQHMLRYICSSRFLLYFRRRRRQSKGRIRHAAYTLGRLPGNRHRPANLAARGLWTDSGW